MRPPCSETLSHGRFILPKYLSQHISLLQRLPEMISSKLIQQILRATNFPWFNNQPKNQLATNRSPVEPPKSSWSAVSRWVTPACVSSWARPVRLVSPADHKSEVCEVLRFFFQNNNNNNNNNNNKKKKKTEDLELLYYRRNILFVCPSPLLSLPALGDFRLLRLPERRLRLRLADKWGGSTISLENKETKNSKTS